MNDFGTEFGQLGAHIGLGDQLPGPDHSNAFKRPEGGNNARRRRPLQALDPLGDGPPEFLDVVLAFDQPRIMQHAHDLPSMSAPKRSENRANSSLAAV